MPDAELLMVPDGHTPWLDSADCIGARVARFLERRLASTEN